MKLISMTDFVLENQGKINNSELGLLACKYANFLKQPLKLEMFVPCDDEGNYWKFPPTQDEWEWAKKDSTEAEQSFKQKEFYYQKAKEKVLFEGFTYNSEDESIEKTETDGSLWSIDADDIVKYTIEDMVQCALILTQNATKQFS